MALFLAWTVRGTNAAYQLFITSDVLESLYRDTEHFEDIEGKLVDVFSIRKMVL